jgi:hypothetical protein
MARWVALTTLGEDKPVMVNLDQVAMTARRRSVRLDGL